jgi:hypothetical protein
MSERIDALYSKSPRLIAEVCCLPLLVDYRRLFERKFSVTNFKERDSEPRDFVTSTKSP